ncbi:capsular exopolysaccharide synthesis family protein [Kineococcus xinjiangensis]|uniref:Capsular exopolysaccharide synthesis family protein n=1 Tax=Kineococcus xinjiangensis TaxID=512762 RepID=A0A2S6II75_9ACTN|nr:polysaccharide biosynthesis tyrosine autokinase [Kineococcus xinjiangensis]PPK93891.1 capsular exopolysaccharide synthesis family protein [Kineococcus xinjiangensis]
MTFESSSGGLQESAVSGQGSGHSCLQSAGTASGESADTLTPGGASEAQVRHYISVLRRRWLSIVLSMLVTIGAAIGVTAALTPYYEARIRLFVVVPEGSVNVGNAYQGGLLSQQRVASYAELVSSSTVTKRVIDRLDLTHTPVELQEHIVASALPYTMLINITVTDQSADTARRVADEVAAVFSEHVHALEAPTAGGKSLIRVRTPDPAHVSPAPVWPKPARSIAVAAALGLLLGLGIALLREALETSISDAEQLSNSASAPTLGVLPEDRQTQDLILINEDDPYSPRAEAFRQLRTHLQFVDIDSPARSLLMTSPREDEGKSTTACNLAISLAQSGVRVCLVEADLRRPRASHYLGLEGGQGLTSVLVGQATLDDVTRSWQDGLMDVLTAGPIPPNPAELLGSSAMRHVLSQLEARYDLVLFDSAPVLSLADSVVLGALTSGVILLGRSERTRREDVKRASAQMRSVGAKVYGTVLVGVRKKHVRGYGYGYGYDPKVYSPTKSHNDLVRNR